MHVYIESIQQANACVCMFEKFKNKFVNNQKYRQQQSEFKKRMNRGAATQNYDTKSSLFSLDYKIPYESSFYEGSKIVQHLQQSQEQLQFLKLKLTQAYEKIQKQININIELSDNNTELMKKIEKLEDMWQAQLTENKKLKEVMETIIKNRRLVEEEVQYTHRRYKKILQEKDQEYNAKIQELQRSIKRLKKQNQTLQESLQERSRKQSVSSSKVSGDRQRKLQHKIQILETQIKKLTTQKVTEVSRLKHQIQCYQRSSLSPIRTPVAQPKSQITTRIHAPKIEYFDIESNHCSQNENTDLNILQNNTIVQSKVTVESKVTEAQSQEDSISKWEKNPSKMKNKNGELTDDQKLTRAQMEKKKVQNQLLKIQRLKRHAPEDRQIMDELEKKIYEIDSQISSLKRKIRQKY